MAFVRAELLTFVSFEATTELLNHQQCFFFRAKFLKTSTRGNKKGPHVMLWISSHIRDAHLPRDRHLLSPDFIASVPKALGLSVKGMGTG